MDNASEQHAMKTLDMCRCVSTGFAASVPFLRGLLDRWHVKPLAFAREEYKSVVSQWTDKGYSKPNKDATQAWLNGWMGQIVHDVAQSRGITTQQVCWFYHCLYLVAAGNAGHMLGILMTSDLRLDVLSKKFACTITSCQIGALKASSMC